MSNDQQTGKWKLGWVLLIMLAALISSRMAYIAPLVLIILYPTAQMISISFVPGTRFVPLWLLHIPYWLIVFIFGFSEQVIFIGMFGSSILGEILLYFILPKSREWKWLVYNSCAMLVLILGYRLVSSFNPSYFNEYVTLGILGVLFGLSALVSMLGIDVDTEEK